MPADRTHGDFGAKLRAARERRGVSLRQIANATKISIAVLEALERNDIARLPGGIFGRAFVRSYAHEVGLDPEATIQDFIAQFPSESTTAGHRNSPHAEDGVEVESERRMAGTFLSLVAISIPLAAMVLYFGTAARRPVRAAPSAVTVEAAAAPPPAPTIAVDAPPIAAEAPAAPIATAGIPTSDGARTTPSADRLMIALSVKRPCWVSATVDGRQTIDRLLQAGERSMIEVRREIVLTAGDASAISMTLNGSDAKPLGKTGEVVTTRLNLTNFKEFLQTR